MSLGLDFSKLDIYSDLDKYEVIPVELFEEKPGIVDDIKSLLIQFTDNIELKGNNTLSFITATILVQNKIDAYNQIEKIKKNILDFLVSQKNLKFAPSNNTKKSSPVSNPLKIDRLRQDILSYSIYFNPKCIERPLDRESVKGTIPLAGEAKIPEKFKSVVVSTVEGLKILCVGNTIHIRVFTVIETKSEKNGMPSKKQVQKAKENAEKKLLNGLVEQREQESIVNDHSKRIETLVKLEGDKFTKQLEKIFSSAFSAHQWEQELAQIFSLLRMKMRSTDQYLNLIGYTKSLVQGHETNKVDHKQICKMLWYISYVVPPTEATLREQIVESYSFSLDAFGMNQTIVEMGIIENFFENSPELLFPLSILYKIPFPKSTFSLKNQVEAFESYLLEIVNATYTLIAIPSNTQICAPSKHSLTLAMRLLIETKESKICSNYTVIAKALFVSSKKINDKKFIHLLVVSFKKLLQFLKDNP